MHVSKIGVFAVVILPAAISMLAQSPENAPTGSSAQSSSQDAGAQAAQQAPPETAQPQPTLPRSAWSHPRRQVSCFRLVGVDPAAVNQRWHILDNAKGKIGAVCTDPSLTAEKKREKIREINEETEQEIRKIIPAKQLEAVKACEAEQEKTKRPGEKTEKELGPCGGVIPAQSGAPQHSHGNQPGNPPKH